MCLRIKIVCDIVYMNIVYDVVYDIIYDVSMLPVDSCLENDDRITLCLGSSVEVVTFKFPFDASKRSKMGMRTTNNVVDENEVEFSCCPLVLALVRDA